MKRPKRLSVCKLPKGLTFEEVKTKKTLKESENLALQTRILHKLCSPAQLFPP